jgi:hypothetical protein
MLKDLGVIYKKIIVRSLNSILFHFVGCDHEKLRVSRLRGGLHYGPRAMTMKF